MPACSAYGCTNRPGKKIKGISFHRFPKHPILREAWVKACRRLNWSPSKVSVLCSEHFSEDQIDRTSFKTVHLKEKAVPNIFKSFPSYYQKGQITSTMPGCSAVGCTNRPERKLPGVTFHRFPKDSVLRAAWIVACRRKDWLPTRTSILCNEHFSEDLMDRTSLTVVRLRENAIPNIFKDSSKKSDLQKISEKHLAPTPMTAFSNEEETQSCDERTSETTKESDAMETAVCLSSPENESSVEYVLPAPAPERGKSPKKHLAFKAGMTFVNEVIQSSDESTSEIPTNYDMVKPTVCLNSPVNESSVENGQIPEISRLPKNCLLSTAATTCINNEMRQTTACLNSPISESRVENRPLVQYLQKCKSPEKHLASTTDTAFSDSEVIESSDESISETSTKYGVMEPRVCLTSAANESNVEIPVQESDSELYPTEDIEKIYLKRKLAKSNNIISKYRKKIKVLQQQNRRWKKQLNEAKRSLNILNKLNKSIFYD